MGVPEVERTPFSTFHAVVAGCSPSLVIKVQPSRPLARRSVFFDSSPKERRVENAMSESVRNFMFLCGSARGLVYVLLF